MGVSYSSSPDFLSAPLKPEARQCLYQGTTAIGIQRICGWGMGTNSLLARCLTTASPYVLVQAAER